MKKILSLITSVLAINFLVVAGGIGFLASQKKLSNENVTAIKDILFKAPTTQPATQPSDDDAPEVDPSMRLEELLARQSGRPAKEQVEFIQDAFDSQMVQLDRRARELADLQRQVDLANQKLVEDRKALETEKQQVAAQSDLAARTAGDKGFQTSLDMYNSMPSKNVKQIFATLDDATVMKYLQAMQPRAAAKIVKEFKTPEEVARIQKVMEMIRQAPTQVSVKE